MARVERNWERLVRATLQREQLRSGGRAGGRVSASGLVGSIPSSLGRGSNIDAILHAADEIQTEDPNVARILCEHAYSLAQNLDPASEGRGVLQFKTGLMSVIKQKLAKKDGARFDRSQDITRLREFYKEYRERHRVDELQEEEQKWRASGAFNGDLAELERRTVKMKRVYATLKVLGEVVEALTRDATPEEADILIPEEVWICRNRYADMVLFWSQIWLYNLKKIKFLVYDARLRPRPPQTLPDTYLVWICQGLGTDMYRVKAAVAALRYSRDLPQLPNDFPIPKQRSLDIFDLLQYTFGFQRDNVSNQREHVVLLIANSQARLGVLEGVEPRADEASIHNVFAKSLDNYMKWCKYLRKRPIWNSVDALNKQKKLMLVALYFLIWGEAANIRFLPECICYIFHNMAKELEEISQQPYAQPAKSCIEDNVVSFLQQIILPVYEIVAAEAASNDNGKASHSAWRNYDDFNEYFWSSNCFELGWPWNRSAKFFIKPKRKAKGMHLPRGRIGKSSFVEHRTFLHLYHSFHRFMDFLGNDVP
ncbi:hypothetical protein KI387_014267, partial [Taxus chinensis]